MIRTFHPIGQGAFYSEQFENYTIVYDCGSATRVALVENEIKKTFSKNHLINAVFISHFHVDHVNGLEFLLKYCNIQNIFLPLLNDDEKIQLLIHNSIQGSNNIFIRNLVLNPINTLSEFGVHVYLIPPIDEEPRENQEDEGTTINIEENDYSNGNLPQGKIKLTSLKIPNWVFIPFNFQRTERSRKLKDELTKKNISINNISDFDSIWADSQQKTELISAYKKIPGGFNTNSMTLYSGFEQKSPYIDKLYNPREFWYCCHFEFWNLSGCLYLGDYDAKGASKWANLYREYASYWNNIGVIQIGYVTVKC